MMDYKGAREYLEEHRGEVFNDWILVSLSEEQFSQVSELEKFFYNDRFVCRRLGLKYSDLNPNDVARAACFLVMGGDFLDRKVVA